MDKIFKKDINKFGDEAANDIPAQPIGHKKPAPDKKKPVMADIESSKRKGKRSRPVITKFRTITPVTLMDPEFGNRELQITSHGRVSLIVNDLADFDYDQPERKLEEIATDIHRRVLESYSGTVPTSKLNYLKDEIETKMEREFVPYGITANDVEILNISYTDESKRLIEMWKGEKPMTQAAAPVIEPKKLPDEPKPEPEPEPEPEPDNCPACGCPKTPGSLFCDRCGFKY